MVMEMLLPSSLLLLVAFLCERSIPLTMTHFLTIIELMISFPHET